MRPGEGVEEIVDSGVNGAVFQESGWRAAGTKVLVTALVQLCRSSEIFSDG
jgi:hypothetical protein